MIHGIKELIAIRKRGRIPSNGVMFETATRPAWQTGLVEQPWGLADAPIDTPDTICLSVAPTAPFDALDLRALRALPVLVFGWADDAGDRAIMALCMACVTAGAARVAGLVYRRTSDNTSAPDCIFRHNTELQCLA